MRASRGPANPELPKPGPAAAGPASHGPAGSGWAAKLRRKARIGVGLLGELLLQGRADGLLRVAAERLIPALERQRNRIWADRLRIALLRGQPGLRASAVEVRQCLAGSQLLIPPGWRVQGRQHRRLARRLAQRMARSGAVLVSCDDWLRDRQGRRIWRQKPLWDPLYDHWAGPAPLLVRQSLLQELEHPLASARFSPAWRQDLQQLARQRGGHAHVPLPLLEAPEPRPLEPRPPEESQSPTPATPTPASPRPSSPRLSSPPSLSPPSPSPTPPRPLLSVLIPTAGQVRPIAGQSRLLLRHCLQTLLARSSYRPLEVVVIDGGEVPPAVVAELTGLLERELGPEGWQWLHDAGPFNYSARLNRAAAAARGELLLQLNDDTELLAADVGRPDGLEQLLACLEQTGAGIAGALLLYPDGRVQHAGTAIDNQAPRHAWSGCRPQDLPWGTLEHPRTFHAVTAAVCLCRRSLWQELGGLSLAFPINYGDVDFCLRAAQRGAATVLEPASRWIHHESASRPIQAVPPELAVFGETWMGPLGGSHNVDDYCSVWRHLLAPHPQARQSP